MKTKEELKLYFENGDIPRQEDFWAWQDSYWHKEEKIDMTKIAGLENGFPRLNDYYAKIDAEGNATFAHLLVKKLYIEPGTLYIPDRFVYANYINEVYFANSVTRIGVEAFAVNSFKSVTLPQQLKTINEKAFMGNELASLIIPEGVTEIKESAFEYNKLTSLYIPATVSKIGPKAFNNNPNLSMVKLDKYTQYYPDSFDPKTTVSGGTLISEM
ncbi:FNIP repeat-containing protein [Chryseobacterium sp. StRB126]|uniref:leucine-rich repeat domain-containing protein n=1 Tax=Chryseobacterium sp. StRB126 TaxID=878220 RepID=UPI0004E98D19|nr:leucine-rich repeat domain-containing protein [Chryseobacterium sp. StRB126]BAP29372.1 FNIP repeat-containing protein [Chryseobacterium sp. StRB126]